ncbi:MAG: CoA-binding protein [Pseudomonadota bacterium]
MNHDHYPPHYIRRILDETKTVAIVGASANPIRPSFFVVKYLIDKGYTVWPVNPGRAGKEICGAMTYATLADCPGTPDLVDIFRAGDAVPQVMAEILALDPLPKTVWMQLGVRNDEVAKVAEMAGMEVVMDRCPKIEYGRHSGEIAWVGYNRELVSAKKPILRKGFQHFGLDS